MAEPRSAFIALNPTQSADYRCPVCHLCAATPRGGVTTARKVGQIVGRGRRTWLVRLAARRPGPIMVQLCNHPPTRTRLEPPRYTTTTVLTPRQNTHRVRSSADVPCCPSRTARSANRSLILSRSLTVSPSAISDRETRRFFAGHHFVCRFILARVFFRDAAGPHQAVHLAFASELRNSRPDGGKPPSRNPPRSASRGAR
jgi:hypothetical protein